MRPTREERATTAAAAARRSWTPAFPWKRQQPGRRIQADRQPFSRYGRPWSDQPPAHVAGPRQVWPTGGRTAATPAECRHDPLEQIDLVHRIELLQPAVRAARNQSSAALSWIWRHNRRDACGCHPRRASPRPAVRSTWGRRAARRAPEPVGGGGVVLGRPVVHDRWPDRHASRRAAPRARAAAARSRGWDGRDRPAAPRQGRARRS